MYTQHSFLWKLISCSFPLYAAEVNVANAPLLEK